MGALNSKQMSEGVVKGRRTLSNVKADHPAENRGKAGSTDLDGRPLWSAASIHTAQRASQRRRVPRESRPGEEGRFERESEEAGGEVAEGMDLNGLEGGTAVTARFLGLLPEFAPHVNEIGRCIGFVVGDAVIPEDEDRTISIRMKGHVAAACTRRKISPDQRQQASKQEALHANGGLDDRLVRRRSEAEKARMKEGKKRRRRARKTEAPKLVYRRKENVSPLPSDSPSSSSPLHDPPPDSQGSGLDISSSCEGINSAYEWHFPSLVEIAKKSAEEKSLKTARRSSRLNP
ncbi:hypothetical protein L7F22_026434 [Adiantum nelumboides]|nr:hypothetical protein [Adiantum nelumboides]